MYPVTVRVILRAKDGRMGLSRSLELPFPPYPGLQLAGITTGLQYPETVLDATWDLVAGCFQVELADWESTEYGIAELIDYFGPDWQLNEPGTEGVPGE